MTRREELTTQERVGRVHAVLVAARRLADPNDPLGEEARVLLPAATGLSEAGVELGLSRHLETSASDTELERLLARAGSAPSVHVLLSANVFVAAVRAVALAVAASRSVRVRPSSREAIMAPLLHRAAVDATGVAPFVICERVESAPGDVIHVYGRLETIAAVERESRPGVRVVGHGPGFGIALVDARSDPLPLAAERLSWDVIAFDQRGCLSPRIALVHGSVRDAETFADRLAVELEQREGQVPRGALTEDERREQALYHRTMSAVGRCQVGATFTVGVDPAPRGLTLPPSGRHVHVARIEETKDFARLFEPFQNAVTCVGRHDPETSMARSVVTLLRGARSLPLGRMQSPPLDGPVDLRGML
jgi:hypothetical protein